MRRRDLWRSNAWGLLLRTLLTLLGFALLGLGTWMYIDDTAFARRAVIAPAVLEDVERSAPRESRYKPPSYDFWGTVRYMVDGRDVRARVFLRHCRLDRCFGVQKAGDAITIAFDPQQVERAVLASNGRVSQGSMVLAFGLAAVGLFLVGTAVISIFSRP